MNLNRHAIILLLALPLLLTSACGDSPMDAGASKEVVSKALPRSTPEAHGVSSALIQSFLDELDQLNQAAFDGNAADETGFHSIMILRGGNVIAEGWWAPYEADKKHRLYSLSKSFTSTAVGFAIDEGFFGLDDPVVSFFPEEVPAEVSDNLAMMTVHDLLIMSTGQESEDRQNDDWAKAFLSIPVEHEPGSVFRYNTSATFMLSAIVQRTTGQTLMEFLTPRFFEPLGIEGATWLMSPKGYNTGGYGLNVKTEDIAKLGQFYLQQGKWNGEQLLPAAWVEKATSFQIANASNATQKENDASDWAQGYGYQFWQTRHNAYRGDGAFGQYSLVIPELDVVIAATAGSTNMQRMLDLIWDHLYPAFKDAPLPEDADAQQALQQKLAALTLLPENRPEAPPLAQKISGESYVLAANTLEVDNFALQIEEDTCKFILRTGNREDTITCGLNDWVAGTASGSFLPGGWQSADAPATLPVAASGRWTAPQTFQMTLRFVEAPDYFVFTASFDDDGVMVKRNGYGMFGGGGEIVLTSKKAS